MRRIGLGLLLVFSLFVAACGSGGGETAAQAAGDHGGDDGDLGVDVDTTDADDAAGGVTLPDYEALAAGVAQATSDSSLPPVAPESPIGALGYSRYVYTESGGEVLATLIEGPLGLQVRCQEEANDCSYLELKALYESGDEVPAYLGMDRVTLGELVGQLDRVHTAIMKFDDIGDACAAGFSRVSNQVPNMGIHMIREFVGRFDPDRPQMVLFAKDGGVSLGSAQVGNCVGGEWTGDDGYRPVGAVFNVNPSVDHPEGFAGPIDNWHIHYNTCTNRSADGQAAAVVDGSLAATSAARCAEQGGDFNAVIPTWMMHAYVADDFDAQSGVFSMFNPTIWPLSSTEELVSTRTVDEADVRNAPILNFDFGEISVGVGETVRFSNSDSVPHTVTAGSFYEPSDRFDSGILGPGQAFDVSFDEPGEYQLFCVLHPDMTGTVVVG